MNGDLFRKMLLGEDAVEAEPLAPRLTEAQLAQYFRHRNGTCPGCAVCAPTGVDPECDQPAREEP